jgi:LysR family glycine cleavage system transcriptional activator
LPPRNAILAAPLLRYDGARHTVLDWQRWCAQLFGDNHGTAAVAEQIDFDGGPSFASFSDMLDACRRGEGLALVRSSLVSADLAAGKLVRSFVESLPSDLHYHLVSSPAQRSKPEVAAFRNWILACSSAPAT